MHVTRDHLLKYPDQIFVYGDNTFRTGKGGAAALRDEPNTYGFITKKRPTNEDHGFFKPDEYEKIYLHEILKLKSEIARNPHKIYLISKLGAGLANKFYIWEKVIEPRIKTDLQEFTNVKFLW
ncbi:MAG: hypothetical protein WC877_00290 [Dehalococcoidales bacterium]|jgi:hypothetical protein